MTAATLIGGCQCGAVRFEVDGPVDETHHCHCQMCRKMHGAMMVTFSTITHDRFRLTVGTDSVVHYASSPGYERLFCPTCGSHVGWVSLPESGDDAVGIAAGCLDEGADPGHADEKVNHIFVGSKAPWFEIADGLPQFEAYADE